MPTVLHGHFPGRVWPAIFLKEKLRHETHYFDAFADSLRGADRYGTRLGTRGAREIFASPRVGHG
jgi:hypothetical protein